VYPVTEPSKRSFPEWRAAAVFDAQLLRGKGEVQDREIQRLSQAVARWGFFELHNHGVDHQCRQDLLAAQRAFFALPDSQKRSLQRTSINSRGYNPGELTKNRLDARRFSTLDTSRIPWQLMMPWSIGSWMVGIRCRRI